MQISPIQNFNLYNSNNRISFKSVEGELIESVGSLYLRDIYNDTELYIEDPDSRKSNDMKNLTLRIEVIVPRMIELFGQILSKENGELEDEDAAALQSIDLLLNKTKEIIEAHQAKTDEDHTKLLDSINKSLNKIKKIYNEHDKDFDYDEALKEEPSSQIHYKMPETEEEYNKLLEVVSKL